MMQEHLPTVEDAAAQVFPLSLKVGNIPEVKLMLNHHQDGPAALSEAFTFFKKNVAKHWWDGSLSYRLVNPYALLPVVPAVCPGQMGKRGREREREKQDINFMTVNLEIHSFKWTLYLVAKVVAATGRRHWRELWGYTLKVVRGNRSSPSWNGTQGVRSVSSLTSRTNATTQPRHCSPASTVNSRWSSIQTQSTPLITWSMSQITALILVDWQCWTSLKFWTSSV